MPPLSSVPPTKHHGPSRLSPSSLSPAAREAVLARYSEDSCFLGYAACATEALRLARERLERPVRCGQLADTASADSDATWDVSAEVEARL